MRLPVWSVCFLVAAPLHEVRGQGSVTAALDGFLSRHLAEVPVPGFSAVVVRDGRVIFAKGYGVEVAGGGKPLTTNSPIAIGSLTKSFTALALMRLVEEGKIDLDRPVVGYLPWFRTADRRGAEITLRMLINNTSGLPSQDRWLFDRDTDEGAIERATRDLARVALSRAPGKSFEYANEGWTVAGAVIEAVTGQRYSQFLEAAVLEPLGMTRSSTALDRFPAIGALWGHLATADGVAPAPPRFLAAALPAGSELRVSAADVGRYLAMFQRWGATDRGRLLTERSVRTLFEPGIVTTADMPEMGLVKAKVGYAMGWLTGEADGRILIHHGGDAITMGSWTVIDTLHRVAASLLYNGPVLDAYRFPGKIWVVNNLLHLALGEPITDFGLPREKDPTLNGYQLPASLAERYLGSYLGPTGQKATIRRGPGPEGLRLELDLGPYATSYDLDFANEASVVLRNISGGLTANFAITPAGKVTGLTGALPGGEYRRRTDEELARVRSWRSPSGRFSLELPPRWEVRWRGDELVARDPGDSSVTLSGRLGPSHSADSTARPGARREAVGRYEWVRSWRTDRERQIIEAVAREGSVEFRLTATAAVGTMTRLLRDVIVPLQQSLDLAPPPLRP